ERDKRLIGEWVDAGCPEGDAAELPPAPVFAEGWNIPEPDLVVQIPQPFSIPAEGVVEYQYFEVDPGFREDRWVQAAEIRPGNRRLRQSLPRLPEAAGPRRGEGCGQTRLLLPGRDGARDSSAAVARGHGQARPRRLAAALRAALRADRHRAAGPYEHRSCLR